MRKLRRRTEHRLSMFKNMTISLLRYKKITTTLEKAKDLRSFAEKIITLCKEDNVYNRRRAAARLHHNDEIVSQLFKEIRDKVMNRNGGYTRILKLGTRKGDGANIAQISLVDF